MTFNTNGCHKDLNNTTNSFSILSPSTFPRMFSFYPFHFRFPISHFLFSFFSSFIIHNTFRILNSSTLCCSLFSDWILRFVFSSLLHIFYLPLPVYQFFTILIFPFRFDFLFLIFHIPCLTLFLSSTKEINPIKGKIMSKLVILPFPSFRAVGQTHAKW